VEITRRRALPSDAELARRVHHDAYREAVERQFGAWDEARQDRFFAAAWAAAEHEILLCDGVPCGYVCVEEHADHVLVREIAVAPAFQGRGIGSAVLRETQARARARGVPVRLGTFLTNRAAALYRRLGFRETGRSTTHIGFEWDADAAAG
jgi:ribosomal protein S18 acetylase RimI-like enzyme